MLNKFHPFLCSEIESTLRARLLGQVRHFSCALQGWLYCVCVDFSIVRLMKVGLYGDLQKAVRDALGIAQPVSLVVQKEGVATYFLTAVKDLPFRVQPFVYTDGFFMCDFDRVLSRLMEVQNEG